MGVGYLVLLIALVPFASSRDLRSASSVNRRTSPDPLLVQLFNDPTATSQLTKQLLGGSDDTSGSGSGLWAVSGDEPKLSDDVTAETVTKPQPVKLANDKSTATVGSGSDAEPTTEDETVETKDDSVTNEDKNAKKSSFIPEQTQTVTDQVEEDNSVRDSTAAPKPDMYDATVVKKNNVPKPDDDKAVSKSVIVHTPERGLAPLTSEEPADRSQLQDPSQLQQSQDLSQMAMQPQQDMSQAAMQPQPDMSQAAMQPQGDVSQYAMQPQQDQPDVAQAQAPVQQDVATPQMMPPSMQNSSLYQGSPLTADAQAQGYGQYLDATQQQSAGAYGQDPNVAAAPMDQAMMQNQAAINPYADQSMAGQQTDPQTGQPIADMRAVPVFQGLKAKKVDIKEDECEDMFDSCPDMAKNNYCENYHDLMVTQCKKSCGFCKVNDEGSGSGSELSESSASGSAMWNDDVQEDNDVPIWRKSGIPSPGDNVVGESPSGSAAATDAWSTSASGENMIKGEADLIVNDEPSAPAEKKESTIETFESGSGQESVDIGSAAGANLAEDLATGTVSKSEEVKGKEVTVPKAKYSEIPVPRVIIQQQPAAEVYPHIDLKVIAKAVNAYKSTALRMLGEAIRDAAQEAEDKAVKRTSIPMPPATELLEKMGFPMEEPKSEIPQYPGYPYAQYYQQQAYAEEQAAAKAKIVKDKAERKKAKAEAEKKAEEDRESSGFEENSKIKDPYQYVREMANGASMKPIESHPGAADAPRDHSSPILLFKNSQMSNEEAAKKASIPKPAVSNFLKQQMPQAVVLAQPKALVPMGGDYVQDTGLEMPASDTQGFVEKTPFVNNQLFSPVDNSAMLRSDATSAQAQAAFVQPQAQAAFVQPQGVEDPNLRELQSYFPGREFKKKRDIKAKGH